MKRMRRIWLKETKDFAATWLDEVKMDESTFLVVLSEFRRSLRRAAIGISKAEGLPIHYGEEFERDRI